MGLFGKRKRIVKRILIVEDEPLVAFDNETMVADAGYEVVATVDDHDDAVEVLESECEPLPPSGDEDEDPRGVHLILTDISLAGDKDGYALAREAKRRGIPVLFVTATPPEGAEELVLGYLLKPYQERTLQAALKMIDRKLSGQPVKKVDGLVLY
ncbi:response regulator [Sphingomonas sp. BN140010]|uniref:Response regulator n=1 Tax=Sphingomonas arvum TaxID=2992113 RepID=A0ABT3JHM3_9SPHN|nr:response regulator [Sphingomonas sp. BN140010]MCW3798539.1 response regulator [Sphingomonas sp. BN140010]